MVVHGRVGHAGVRGQWVWYEVMYSFQFRWWWMRGNWVGGARDEWWQWGGCAMHTMPSHAILYSGALSTSPQAGRDRHSDPVAHSSQKAHIKPIHYSHYHPPFRAGSESCHSERHVSQQMLCFDAQHQQCLPAPSAAISWSSLSSASARAASWALRIWEKQLHIRIIPTRHTWNWLYSRTLQLSYWNYSNTLFPEYNHIPTRRNIKQ